VGGRDGDTIRSHVVHHYHQRRRRTSPVFPSLGDESIDSSRSRTVLGEGGVQRVVVVAVVVVVVVVVVIASE